MNKTFSIKTAECDSGEIHKKAYELETEWLIALLLRAGVSKILIKKALTDESYGAASWRDYLFDKFGITVTKDLSIKGVSVYKISFETGDKVKIGEWTCPDVVRKKEDSMTCKLELKYWQII